MYKVKKKSKLYQEGGQISNPAQEVVSDIANVLKQILDKWENTEYESDKDRWMSYANDIANMVSAMEGGEQREEAPVERQEMEYQDGGMFSASKAPSQQKPDMQAPSYRKDKSFRKRFRKRDEKGY
tara:strand:+ start:189 stop:566 length:378 start_codon:yes stop_codon:yes gene_type:complete